MKLAFIVYKPTAVHFCNDFRELNVLINGLFVILLFKLRKSLIWKHFILAIAETF